jgi:hypothetical protein
MTQEQEESKNKINLLLNVINTTIKIPKFSQTMVKGKPTEQPNGNFEISLLNNQEVEVLKSRVLNELCVIYPDLAAKAPEVEVKEDPAQTKLELTETTE